MVKWPTGRTRTKYPKRAAFDRDLSIDRAQRDLMDELRRIRATDLVVDTDLRKRNDGGYYSAQAQPADQGVVVYFTLPGGKKVCMPCDAWDKIQHNIRAIARTLEAKRAIERWGTATQDAEYEGYAALPSGDAAADQAAAKAAGFAIVTELPPNEVLGVLPTADAETIQGAWRAKAARLHPDRPGGDAAQFQRMTKARDAMLSALEAKA